MRCSSKTRLGKRCKRKAKKNRKSCGGHRGVRRLKGRRKNPPRGKWAVVKLVSAGLDDDMILSTHSSESVAKRKADKLDEGIGPRVVVRNVGPNGQWEIIKIFGKRTLRLRVKSRRKFKRNPGYHYSDEWGCRYCGDPRPGHGGDACLSPPTPTKRNPSTVRCSSKTKLGKRCKRKAKKGRKSCGGHRGIRRRNPKKSIYSHGVQRKRKRKSRNPSKIMEKAERNNFYKCELLLKKRELDAHLDSLFQAAIYPRSKEGSQARRKHGKPGRDKVWDFVQSYASKVRVSLEQYTDLVKELVSEE